MFVWWWNTTAIQTSQKFLSVAKRGSIACSCARLYLLVKTVDKNGFTPSTHTHSHTHTIHFDYDRFYFSYHTRKQANLHIRSCKFGISTITWVFVNISFQISALNNNTTAKYHLLASQNRYLSCVILTFYTGLFNETKYKW